MNIMHTIASEARTTKVSKRRYYSPEFKLRVVQTSAHPGASIAGVALQNGINTNIVHRWIREHNQGTLVVQPQSFIPVPLSTQPEPAPTKHVAVVATPEIRMELQRGTYLVTVMWPSELAGDATPG